MKPVARFAAALLGSVFAAGLYAGAANAGLLAAQVIGSFDSEVRKRVHEFRKAQKEKVMADSDLELPK